MDEIYSYLGQSQRLWGPPTPVVVGTTVSVTEIRRRHSGDHFTTHHQVPVNDLSTHLEAGSGSPQDTDDCVLRVVFAHYGQPPSKNDAPPVSVDTATAATAALNHVLDIFGLRPAFDFFSSCAAGIYRLPAAPSDLQTFALSYHPKLALVWSCPPRAKALGSPPTTASSPSELSETSTPATTTAVCFAFPQEKEALERLLERRWPFVGHPLFLAFLCGLQLSCSADDTHQEAKKDVRKTEARSGQHHFSHRSERPALQQMGELSALMNGWTAKLAAVTRKLRVVDAISDFVSKQLDSSSLYDSTDQTAILRNGVDVLRHRTKMQNVDNAYIQQRVYTQINALSNIISQSDSLLSIGIARDSKLIAVSSQHDASSMKTLAIVTMLFLPGSFVASVFSMPMLDWTSKTLGGVISPRFGIFWAVTITLTALTFIVYVLWIMASKRWQQRRNMDATTAMDTERIVEEHRTLSIKQKKI